MRLPFTNNDKTLTLEVIEQNPAGIKLYEKTGFTKQRRLVEGKLENPPTPNQASNKLEQIDIYQAAQFIAANTNPNLPWQISAFQIANQAEPNIALKLKDAVMVISDPTAENIRISNITVTKSERNQRQATQLIQAAFAKYPNKNWLYSALCPEEYEGFFLKQGFKRGELSQFQMQLHLD